VLVLDRAQDSSLALVRKNTAETRRLARGPIVAARLLAHDVVVVATETRLVALVGTQPPRELVKLDGGAEGVVRLGATGFAALSAHGELVRGGRRDRRAGPHPRHAGHQLGARRRSRGPRRAG